MKIHLHNFLQAVQSMMHPCSVVFYGCGLTAFSFQSKHLRAHTEQDCLVLEETPSLEPAAPSLDIDLTELSNITEEYDSITGEHRFCLCGTDFEVVITG